MKEFYAGPYAYDRCCGTCVYGRFSERKLENGIETVSDNTGKCTKNPPVFIAEIYEDRRRSAWQQPIVAPDDYCGEYRYWDRCSRDSRLEQYIANLSVNRISIPEIVHDESNDFAATGISPEAIGRCLTKMGWIRKRESSGARHWYYVRGDNNG